MCFNQAIEGRGAATATSAEAAETPGAAGRNPEISRAEIPYRAIEIHMVQDVLEVHAKRQVVAFWRVSTAKTTAAEATTTAAATAAAAAAPATGKAAAETAATTATAAATTTLAIITPLAILLAAAVLRGAAPLATEPDGFADPQVRDDRTRALGEVARDDRRAG